MEKVRSVLWSEYKQLDSDARGVGIVPGTSSDSSTIRSSCNCSLHSSATGSHRRSHSLYGPRWSGSLQSSHTCDVLPTVIVDPKSASYSRYYYREMAKNPCALSCNDTHHYLQVDCSATNTCQNGAGFSVASSMAPGSGSVHHTIRGSVFSRCTGDNNEDASKTKPSLANSSDVSCTRIFIYTSLMIVIICSALFVGRDYIRYVLLSLERSNVTVGVLIFLALFTAVSFPMTWGYILLNVAAGYLYGVARGIAVVMVCATCGIVCAHIVIRRFLREFVWERISNETMRSIVRVVESAGGFKVIVLARLTPIPFGLQNALFAMSQVSVQQYVLASVMGMLPSQGLHVYIGSTLRSMEEVISSSPSSNLAYFVFGAQLLMAVALLVVLVRTARKEFDRSLEEVKIDSPSS